MTLTAGADSAALAAPGPAAVGPWQQAAEDLRALAWLHAAERPAQVWVSLHRAGFPLGLTLLPRGDEAMQALSHALDQLAQDGALNEPNDVAAQPGPSRADDLLAADYANIYLTNGFSASPYESVWLDEDHLMLQAPTFAVRALYKRHGMIASNWRTMPDDHLAHELVFVAHLLEQGDLAAALQFLDEHLLLWVPQFAQRVSQRAHTSVYAGLAALTGQACAVLDQRLRAAQALS